jgi:hypothetical protein
MGVFICTYIFIIIVTQVEICDFLIINVTLENR